MKRYISVATFLSFLGAASVVNAHVSRVVIDSCAPLDAMGGPNGDIPYEVLNGHFEGALAPEDAHKRPLSKGPWSDLRHRRT